jgi:HlyD family secretion protein
MRFWLIAGLAGLVALGGCGRRSEGAPGGPGARGGGPGGRAPAAARAPTLAEQQAQARTVTVVTVQERALEGGLEASGTLIPREDVAVFPQVSGYRVLRLLADEGQYVSQGQALAVLDDTLLRAQIDQQASLLAQQRVVAERARAEAARVNGLDDTGVLAVEQIQARRFAARSAAAQANAQAASLRDLQTRRGQLTVRAPYGGLILERNVRAGDIASAGGNPWFRIARSGEVELAADVAESALAGLSPGTPVTVTLASGEQVTGSVRLVSPRVETTTRLGRVRISLPVRPDVRAGGFARASFNGIGRPALVVPETAVRYDAAGAAVMLLGPNNRVTRTAVTTGRRGGGYVELLTGPPAGSRVVSRFAAMLVSGDIVRPVLQPQPAGPPPALNAPVRPGPGASPAAPAAGPPETRPPPPTGAAGAQPVTPALPVEPAQPAGTPPGASRRP